MSAHYTVHWNMTTDDKERADDAARTAAALVEDLRCIVYGFRAGPVYDGVVTARVRFQAASDVEAQGIADRIRNLPGLPPVDAVSWRRV
jgi:hypothetical protein